MDFPYLRQWAWRIRLVDGWIGVIPGSVKASGELNKRLLVISFALALDVTCDLTPFQVEITRNFHPDGIFLSSFHSLTRRVSSRV